MTACSVPGCDIEITTILPRKSIYNDKIKFLFDQMPAIQQMPAGEETSVKKHKRPEFPNFKIKEEFIFND